MQTLDVNALDADIAYGGIDQRGIYMLSREVLPGHSGDAPVCVFAPLLSGLSNRKMSASDETSKVNLTDDPDAVVEKIDQAYCPMGETEGNGVLEYLEYLVFPVLDQRGEDFVVERPEEYGGDLVYEDYERLEADFVSEELHPADLKPAAGEYISEVIDPVRERLTAQPDLLAEAYPDAYGEE
jgi:tyrosyl-tRNA synthetase